MLRIASEATKHKLNVDMNHKLVIQKRRHLEEERSVAVAAEVRKLFGAGLIRECQHPKCVSNVILVIKKPPNETCRMKVDFTNLNKASLEDNCPLSKVDKSANFMAGHALG